MTIQVGHVIVNRNTQRSRGKYAPKRVVLRILDDGRLEVWHCKHRCREIIERPENWVTTGERLPVGDGNVSTPPWGAGGIGA